MRNVGLKYDRGPEVLRDLNLDLTPGSFHFLTGPSGAGKTSILRLMLLALKPTRGKIELFGQDVTRLGTGRRAELRRRIGIVFQDFRLLDDPIMATTEFSGLSTECQHPVFGT